jgi:hypothetical protein
VFLTVSVFLAQAVRADPNALFQQAKAAELAGKADDARKLWRDFLAEEPNGQRADKVRNRMVVLEAKDLGKNFRHYPVWSPDGHWLMYGYGGISLVNVKTGEGISMESPTGSMYNHDWSSDGITVACRQKLDNGRPGIFLYERQPDEALFPTGDGQPICEGSMVKFDASGKLLLISAAAKELNGRRVSMGIAIHDPAAGSLRSIFWDQKSTRPARNQAAWMGADSYVFHAYGPAAMADRMIVAAPIQKGGSVVEITSDGADYRTPTVAPDGRRLAFSRREQRGPETLLLATTDGALKPVALGPGREPGWSPDGARLAYDSPQGIRLLRFGGLAASPCHVSGAVKGNAVAITITNDGDAPRTLVPSCQIYDNRSVRLADWSWPDDPVVVAAGQTLSSDYPIPPEIMAAGVTMRFRVQSADAPPEVVLIPLKPAAQGQ